MEPPPLYPPHFPYSDPGQKDAEHLQLLSVFHFVIGALAFLGVGFLALHYWFTRMIFTRPEMFDGKGGHAPPKEFFEIFQWFYVFMALIFILAAVANILSGLYLRQKKNRTFSLVIAGLNCLQMPFGTVLGVFTLIVLMRPSVRQLYGERLV